MGKLTMKGIVAFTKFDVVERMNSQLELVDAIAIRRCLRGQEESIEHHIPSSGQSPQPIEWREMKGTADDLMNDIRWVKLYGAMLRLHPTKTDYEKYSKFCCLDKPTDAKMTDGAHTDLIRVVWSKKIMDRHNGLLEEHKDILDKFCQRKE